MYSQDALFAVTVIFVEFLSWLESPFNWNWFCTISGYTSASYQSERLSKTDRQALVGAYNMKDAWGSKRAMNYGH